MGATIVKGDDKVRHKKLVFQLYSLVLSRTPAPPWSGAPATLNLIHFCCFMRFGCDNLRRVWMIRLRLQLFFAAMAPTVTFVLQSFHQPCLVGE